LHIHQPHRWWGGVHLRAEPRLDERGSGGGSGSLRFEPDTTFLLILVPDPGSPTESAVGPVALDGATVILTDASEPDLPLLRGERAAQRLTLETENAEYDFNGDGTDEPARVSAVFVR
jgi:hypothetical protein